MDTCVKCGKPFQSTDTYRVQCYECYPQGYIDRSTLVIFTPFIAEPIPPTIYWCHHCGSFREAPANLPLYCCGALMDIPENQTEARKLMDGD